MENSLYDAYEIAGVDETRLNVKQREYLDKIFAIAVKVCLINDEPVSILSHELKQMVRDIIDDPIFSGYPDQGEGEFVEYIPGNAEAP